MPGEAAVPCLGMLRGPSPVPVRTAAARRTAGAARLAPPPPRQGRAIRSVPRRPPRPQPGGRRGAHPSGGCGGGGGGRGAGGARGVRDGDAALRARGLPRPRRLRQEHDHRRRPGAGPHTPPYPPPHPPPHPSSNRLARHVTAKRGGVGAADGRGPWPHGRRGSGGLGVGGGGK